MFSSRNRLYALCLCVAVSFTLGAATASAASLPRSTGPHTFTLYHGGSTVAFKNARAVRARLRFGYLPAGYHVNTSYNDFNMLIENNDFSAPRSSGANLFFQAQYSLSRTAPNGVHSGFYLLGTYDSGRVTAYYNITGPAGSSRYDTTSVLLVTRVTRGFAELGYNFNNSLRPTSPNEEVLRIAEGITGYVTSAAAHWPSPRPVI